MRRLRTAVLLSVLTVLATLLVPAGPASAAWTTWVPRPGTGYNPAVASRGPGLLDVFVTGSDGLIYHQAWTGSAWTSWENLQGDGGVISAVAMDSNYLYVATIGTDHRIYTKSWNSSTGWGSWVTQSSTDAYYDVSLASRGPGLLDLFYVDRVHTVYHKSFSNGAWSGWERIGGIEMDNIDAAWMGDRLQVVGVSTAVQVEYSGDTVTRWRTPWARAYTRGIGWEAGWTQLGGRAAYPTGNISVSSRGCCRLEAFVVGSNQAVYTKSYVPSFGWDSGWANLGGGVFSMDSVSWNSLRTDVFAGGYYPGYIGVGDPPYFSNWKLYQKTFLQ